MKFWNALLIFFCALFFPFALKASEVPKLYCMYTPAYETLLREYFLPSLKDKFQVVIREFPQDCTEAQFLTKGWDKTMQNKLKMLREAVLDNWGEIFFYSDVDIIFLKPALARSIELLGDRDFVVQQEWPSDALCAGFFVMRGNAKTLQLITRAEKLLEEGICPDDQVALQQSLNKFAPEKIAWSYLPIQEYPNGRFVLSSTQKLYVPYSPLKVRKHMLLLHANWCVGLENKYHFLRAVEAEFAKLR